MDAFRSPGGLEQKKTKKPMGWVLFSTPHANKKKKETKEHLTKVCSGLFVVSVVFAMVPVYVEESVNNMLLP